MPLEHLPRGLAEDDARQIGYVVTWWGLPQLVPLPLMPLIMRAVDSWLLVVTDALFFMASCCINGGLTRDVGASGDPGGGFGDAGATGTARGRRDGLRGRVSGSSG
jgi:hypothetical protein